MKNVSAKPPRSQTMKTYQEKGVRHESVSKNSPADPSASALSAVGDGGDSNGDNDTDELVARVRDQVVNLALGVDVEEVPSQPKQDKLENDDHAGIAERDS